MDDIKTAAAVAPAGKDEAVESKPLTETADSLSDKIADEIAASSDAKAEPLTETPLSSEVETESPAVEEKSDDIVTETEIDSLLKDEEPVHKDGVQKRIDKLTAQLRTVEEERDRLRAEKATEAPKEGKRYTEEQLKKAWDKAVDENDKDLMWEVQKEREKYIKEDLRKEYLDKERSQIETAQRAAKEWENVVNKYEYLTSPKEPEIYPGSKKELNVVDQKSLIYQVALKLFASDEKYRNPGGQELAIADALALIMRKKREKIGNTGKETLLSRQLAKEKRKSSLGSGDSMKEDNPPKKNLSERESLDEYLSERKKFRDDRVGTI